MGKFDPKDPRIAHIGETTAKAAGWLPHPIAWVVAGVLSMPMLTLPMLGYGRYVSFCDPLFLLFVSACVILCLSKEHRGPRTVATCALLMAAVFGGWYVGWQIRLFHCREIQRRLAPIIRALDQRKATTGAYPAALSELPEAGHPGPSIRQGRFLRDGAVSTDEVGTADATFYLSPDKYACLIPIEKPLPISITGFHIYYYLSESPHWEKDYMVWTIRAL
jgi:hypothetical protein